MPVPPPSPTYHPNRVDHIDPAIEYIAGVDEAGRGPVLGPLVYCLFLIPKTSQDLLAQYEAADSKVLSPGDRRAFFSRCVEDSHSVWLTRILTPLDISDAMLRPVKYNLNELSYDTVYSLLEEVFEKLKIRVNGLFVDTLGDPERYRARLEARFPKYLTGKVTVETKADAKYPVVSAASIIDKVTRDYCLENWVFPDGYESV
jgi:ribonuclease H2 subunit A